jgi:hypothetical protein
MCLAIRSSIVLTLTSTVAAAAAAASDKGCSMCSAPGQHGRHSQHNTNNSAALSVLLQGSGVSGHASEAVATGPCRERVQRTDSTPNSEARCVFCSSESGVKRKQNLTRAATRQICSTKQRRKSFNNECCTALQVWNLPLGQLSLMKVPEQTVSSQPSKSEVEK